MITVFGVARTIENWKIYSAITESETMSTRIESVMYTLHLFVQL